jgi:hypothetical protein
MIIKRKDLTLLGLQPRLAHANTATKVILNAAI